VNVVGFVSLGSVFGSFAGLIAFVITFDEYSRHYCERKEPLRLALEMAVVAFVVFLVLTPVYNWLSPGLRASRRAKIVGWRSCGAIFRTSSVTTVASVIIYHPSLAKATSM
jgi:hypothetical protein